MKLKGCWALILGLEYLLGKTKKGSLVALLIETPILFIAGWFLLRKVKYGSQSSQR